LTSPVIPDDVSPPQVDAASAHPARMYNYVLGGKDCYASDIEAAEKIYQVFPGIVATARENRAFMFRAVHHLASEARISQFLDIGIGLPVFERPYTNLHEVAQRVTPTARVIYVDNDPLVLLHARALMGGTPEGIVKVVDWDLRDPTSIFEKFDLTGTLDLDQPVALSLGAILHFIPDEDQPADLVARLVEPLASGSYLTISHGASDPALHPYCLELAQQVTKILDDEGIPLRLRTRAQIEALVPTGLEIITPGVVPLHRWRPDSSREVPNSYEIAGYGLVAHKP